MTIIQVQQTERYTIDEIPSDKRWRVWDREECKHVGGSAEDKATAEYLRDKLNGKLPNEKGSR